MLMDSVEIEKIYPGDPDPQGLTKNCTPKADDPCVNRYEQTLLERATDGLGDWKEIKADFEQQLRHKHAKDKQMYEEMKTGQQAENQKGLESTDGHAALQPQIEESDDFQEASEYRNAP
jgi:hypothetical protein